MEWKIVAMTGVWAERRTGHGAEYCESDEKLKSD